MRNLGYSILKFWIKTALHFYFGRILVTGLDAVPEKGPVLFLPNHQNALLDVLLLAVHCGRKPFFLTRSDIFAKPMLKRFFNYLQMIPVYRMRDGLQQVKKNKLVFKTCASLLRKQQAILMFPEGNHNGQRRVRTLSPGFTRIVLEAWRHQPGLNVKIVPIGLNYQHMLGFPDSVHIKFGQPIAARAFLSNVQTQDFGKAITAAVAEQLKTLTTHISDEEAYQKIIAQLNAVGTDYLNPTEANSKIQKLAGNDCTARTPRKGSGVFWKALFILLNLPVVSLWKWVVKPRVWEPEFTATLRFAVGLLCIPFYAILLFVLLFLGFGVWTGFGGLVLWAMYNRYYIKTA